MTNGRLFISHANEDAAVADRIVAYLEAHGAPCWISSRDIPPRAIYADAITEAMQAASACLVILSATSNTSKAVKRELELASHYDKPFIPIRIDATEPGAGVDYYLRNTQWLDYKRDGERALDRIVAQGATAAAAAPGAPPSPRPAQPSQAQTQSSGASWQTIAIIAVVIALLGGVGLYFLQRGQQMQAAQSGADPSALIGSYNWDGVACADGPHVSVEGGQLVFAMTGEPTYRHDIMSGDGATFETRVTEPAEHRGDTYYLAPSSNGLSVTTGGHTDQWTRCDDADAAEAAAVVRASVADSTWVGVWGDENVRVTWALHADGRACGVYGDREVCDWNWAQDGEALTIRSGGETWSGRLNGNVYSGQLRQGHSEELQADAPPKPFRLERQS